MNTVLDDIASVIGFSNTLKVVAWYGDGIANLYVPAAAEEGQVLVKLIGLGPAQKLSQEFPRQHLAIPRLHNYELEMRKRVICRMIERGFSYREIAGMMQISTKRVWQIEGELKELGLISSPKNGGSNKSGRGDAAEELDQAMREEGGAAVSDDGRRALDQAVRALATSD